MPLGSLNLLLLLVYCGDLHGQAGRDIPVRSIQYEGSYIFRDSAVLSRKLHIDYYDGPDELGEFYRISFKGFVWIGLPGPVFRCHPDSVNCARDSVSIEMEKIRTRFFYDWLVVNTHTIMLVRVHRNGQELGTFMVKRWGREPEQIQLY